MSKIQYLLCLVFLYSEIGECVHNCIHDHVARDQQLIAIDDSELHSQRRLLQFGYGYGPLRIHKEYNTTTISTNDVIGKNLIKIMNIIAEFWSRTIQIEYTAGLSFKIPPGFDSSKYKCMSFQVPKNIIDNITPNKDFGLLIEALDDGDSGITAYSIPCAYSQTSGRPLWGFIHWNKNYLSFSPINFQENIHIGIHQIMHVLGFSQVLYEKYANKNIFQTVSGGTYLNGPYLQAEIKRQYGCDNAPGMSLETNGGSGTAFSHWSRKTAANQLMTAGVAINNPTISYITLALLEETGWYRKIYKRFGRFINFGYQKGCQMLNASDCSSNQYCKIQDEKRVDYDRTALGYCKNDSLTRCLYTKFYVNFICTDPNYAEKSLHADQGVINITGQIGGANSRCYNSDLRLAGATATKYSFRCYETLCSPNYQTLTIKVGRTFAFCKFPNQQVTVNGYVGTIQCPNSFKQVCAVKRCPKECNANGICLEGTCLCQQSYEGQYCDKLSSSGFQSSKTLFLSSQNNNCVIGSYRNVFGDCEPCSPGCAKCNDEGCMLCLNQSLPVFGFCPT